MFENIDLNCIESRQYMNWRLANSMRSKSNHVFLAAIVSTFLSAGVLQGAEAADPNGPFEPAALYPQQDRLIASAGGRSYFVDPAKGDDSREGTAADKAWKSLAKINALKLAPGDKVTIAPGLHEASLKPSGEGTAENPIVIQFLPGVHEFSPQNAVRRLYFVSNSCDAPTVPKRITILVDGARHVSVRGGGVEGPGKTEILIGGRMTEVLNDHAEDIAFSGLVFDLKRPTVSEFRVLESGGNEVVIEVAEASTYEIKDGKFAWTGDLGSGWIMSQQGIPAAGKCWRQGEWDPFGTAQAVDLGNRKVRLTYAKGTHDLIKDRQLQFRHVNRDSVGIHNTRSKDIVFRDCDFYALTNMGFVSQFTENITYQRVNVAPPKGTLRTCPAHGDIFQFSNCKGNLLVDSCKLSGMQDDAINCHGTHLRVIEKAGENQLLVRFVNAQTYSFAAYAPGDEVAVINHSNLRELPGNPRRKVTAVIPSPKDKSGKDWLLTLDGPAPVFGNNDVLDNITWYPNITARNNHISMDPVRGFLFTTRGKVLVEGNTFLRCAMPGILIEDDAEGWFESGPVRDLTIRNNRFIECGIQITPQSHSNNPEEWVHENIRIEGNYFENTSLFAKNVKGLTITANRFTAKSLPLEQKACSDVHIEKNFFDVKE